MKALWEILVPTTRNNGTPIRVRQHRVWDTKVREIAGGLSIFKPLKGEWVAPDGTLFKERMIPVRILCSYSEILQIADFTAKFYEQQAVMYYQVSSQVVIQHYGNDGELRHAWFVFKQDAFESCRRCGIIRASDSSSDDKKCSGIARITTRAQSTTI